MRVKPILIGTSGAMIWSIIWISVYIAYLSKLPISDNPEQWAHFATFFGGVVLTPVTLFASITAAYFVAKSHQQNVNINELDSYKDKVLRFKDTFDESLKTEVFNDKLRSSMQGDYIGKIIREYSKTKPSKEEQGEVIKLANSIVGYLDTLAQCAFTYTSMMNQKILETENQKEAQVTTEYFIWFLRYNPLAKDLQKLCEPEYIQSKKHFMRLFVLDPESEDHFIHQALRSNKPS